MVRMIGATRGDVVFWMAGPLPIVLLIALVIATFYHLQLGLQVVIEDYVTTDALRIGSILLMKGVSVLLALVCIISVLRLGL
jgi:succinate dehydrogenase / fumarate reductase membrane anchor subunit